LVDKKIQAQVKEKVHAIEAVKDRVRNALSLTTSKEDVTLLKRYKSEMEAMETVDFASELAKVNEKILLTGDLRRVSEADKRVKYSL
jgi:phage terminase Nu1 subunit (DNA packaging protein)